MELLAKFFRIKIGCFRWTGAKSPASDPQPQLWARHTPSPFVPQLRTYRCTAL